MRAGHPSMGKQTTGLRKLHVRVVQARGQRPGTGVLLAHGEAVAAAVGDVALRVGLNPDGVVVPREQVPEPLADMPVQVVLALLGVGQSEHRLDDRSEGAGGLQGQS